MIANNYFYAGTTAIIYNLEVDYPSLGFYYTSWGGIRLAGSSTLTEVGVEYKKNSDTNWIRLTIIDSTVLTTVKNGRSLEYAMSGQIYTDYLYNAPKSKEKSQIMIPVRIVIRNLVDNTLYNVRSYYIDNGTTSYFNSCSPQTLPIQDITYVFTSVTGDGDSTEKNKLLDKINSACTIYNSMTSFKTSTASADSLRSSYGGSFTAKIDHSLAEGANSNMEFKSGTYTDESMIVHEMAHNLMYDEIDESYSQTAHDEIVKFMEFATHSENATWRWLGSHNYPVISSEDYWGVENYLVAAACYVCRKASNRL